MLKGTIFQDLHKIKWYIIAIIILILVVVYLQESPEKFSSLYFVQYNNLIKRLDKFNNSIEKSAIDLTSNFINYTFPIKIIESVIFFLKNEFENNVFSEELSFKNFKFSFFVPFNNLKYKNIDNYNRIIQFDTSLIINNPGYSAKSENMVLGFLSMPITFTILINSTLPFNFIDPFDLDLQNSKYKIIKMDYNRNIENNVNKLSYLPYNNYPKYYRITNKLHLLPPFDNMEYETQLITEQNINDFNIVLNEKNKELQKYRNVNLEAVNYTGNLNPQNQNEQAQNLNDLNENYQGYCFKLLPNGQSRVMNKQQFECIGEDELYDTPAINDNQCPFYKYNKNFNNEMGGIKKIPVEIYSVDGKANTFELNFCEMPQGIERIGFKKYNSINKPLCHCYPNNETLSSDCCEIQNDKNLYPFLLTPDYAFENDTTIRRLNGF